MVFLGFRNRLAALVLSGGIAFPLLGQAAKAIDLPSEMELYSRVGSDNAVQMLRFNLLGIGKQRGVDIDSGFALLMLPGQKPIGGFGFGQEICFANNCVYPFFEIGIMPFSNSASWATNKGFNSPVSGNKKSQITHVSAFSTFYFNSKNSRSAIGPLIGMTVDLDKMSFSLAPGFAVKNWNGVNGFLSLLIGMSGNSFDVSFQPFGYASFALENSFAKAISLSYSLDSQAFASIALNGCMASISGNAGVQSLNFLVGDFDSQSFSAKMAKSHAFNNIIHESPSSFFLAPLAIELSSLNPAYSLELENNSHGVNARAGFGMPFDSGAFQYTSFGGSIGVNAGKNGIELSSISILMRVAGDNLHERLMPEEQGKPLRFSGWGLTGGIEYNKGSVQPIISFESLF